MFHNSDKFISDFRKKRTSVCLLINALQTCEKVEEKL